MSKFFNKLPKPEKQVSKSISLNDSDWQLIEAYRKYGESSVGFNIHLNKIMREVILNHIESDRDFAKVKDQWLEATTKKSSTKKKTTTKEDINLELNKDDSNFWNSSLSLSR